MTSLRAVTALAALLFTAFTGGCSSTIQGAGYTQDYREVFTATFTRENYWDDNFTWSVVMEPSQVPCSIQNSSRGPNWHHRISCDDGRTGMAEQKGPGGPVEATGQLSDGTTITLIWSGSRPDVVARKYQEFRAEQQRRLAAAAAAPRGAGAGAPAAASPAAAQAPPSPPVPAVRRNFPRGPERPDDIAVIVGNAEYGRLGRDIPDVRPAHADAEGARLYATQALGIKDGNVIFLKDATSAHMVRVFGSRDRPHGQLHDWVKPGKSRVFVYYSGHGAPGPQGDGPMLVPTDSDATRIELNGYPLKQLYDNLGKLPAESVTVVLEACFSGMSPGGSVVGAASPVFVEVKVPPVPTNLTVIAAGAADQMASWEPDGSHGLFTRHFLDAVSGKADADKDGTVSLDELDRYLSDTLTYFARRHYGRDQRAQIVRGGRPQPASGQR